ncbi:hypothetical protein BLA29_001903, partial [Euroglyphus maynei]
MPFFRCPLPRFDSPKTSFRFDSNSWPTYLRNSIIQNDEKQQDTSGCLNDETKLENKPQKIQTVDCRANQSHYHKLVLNQRCPFFRYNENYSKVKIIDDERGSDRKSDENRTKHRFNFDSLNIRLLETFGFIGTALVVGFDIRSRINQWSPAQHRHISYRNHCCCDNRQRLLTENGDFFRSKTIYIGSCRLCSYIFDKIFAMPSIFPSLSPNIIEEKPSTIKINGVHGPTNTIASTTTTTNGIAQNIEEELERVLCLQPEQTDRSSFSH